MANRLQAVVEKIAANQYQIGGDVTVYTVASLASVWRQTVDLPSATEVTIDFGAVGKTDSGTLALLLNWQRKAKQENTTVVFTHLPESLRALIGL